MDRQKIQKEWNDRQELKQRELYDKNWLLQKQRKDRQRYNTEIMRNQPFSNFQNPAEMLSDPNLYSRHILHQNLPENSRY
jgi:hypothetical protein